MARKSNTATAPATDGATEATEAKKKKAKAGSSIPAQAKHLVLAIFSEISEAVSAGFENVSLADLVSEGTYEQWVNLRDQILESSSRGIPLKDQIEATEKEMASILSSASIVDGKIQLTEAQNSRYEALAAKKHRLNGQVKREAAKNKTAETATEVVNE